MPSTLFIGLPTKHFPQFHAWITWLFPWWYTWESRKIHTVNSYGFLSLIPRGSHEVSRVKHAWSTRDHTRFPRLVTGQGINWPSGEPCVNLVWTTCDPRVVRTWFTRGFLVRVTRGFLALFTRGLEVGMWETNLTFPPANHTWFSRDPRVGASNCLVGWRCHTLFYEYIQRYLS